jgi:hypothetical protein
MNSDALMAVAVAVGAYLTGAVLGLVSLLIMGTA